MSEETATLASNVAREELDPATAARSLSGDRGQPPVRGGNRTGALRSADRRLLIGDGRAVEDRGANPADIFD